MKTALQRTVSALIVCLAACAYCQTIQASILRGTDYLETLPGTFFDFGGPIGSVSLKGLPISPSTLGTTDTIVQRKADFLFPPSGSSTTIPIELVQLSLVSVAPISIFSTPYSVFVHLTPSTSSTGIMTIRHEFPESPGPAPEGTFDSFFDVFFTADFTEIGNPLNTFSVSDHTQLGSMGTPWSHDPVPGTLLITGSAGDPDANNHTGRPPLFSDFHIPQQIVETKLLGGPGAHIVREASPVPEPSAIACWLGLTGLGWLVSFAGKKERT
jgi:hypothetical protein